MKRYVNTFFRYWLVVLIPLIVLPVGDYVIALRHIAKTTVANATVWVNPIPGTSAYGYPTAAQFLGDQFNEFKSSPAFDGQVATLAGARFGVLEGAGAVQTNMSIYPVGPDVLVLSYSSKHGGSLGEAAINAFLNAARQQEQTISQQQAANGLPDAEANVTTAQQLLSSDLSKLHDYMSRHNISVSDLPTQILIDPTLSSLYTTVQVDNTNLTNASTTRATIKASSAQANNYRAPFRLQDPPGPGSDFTKSVRSQFILNLGVAFGVALLLSLLFIVVRTALDRGIRFADEIPQLFDLPVLAVVPYRPTLAAPQRPVLSPPNATAVTGR